MKKILVDLIQDKDVNNRRRIIILMIWFRLLCALRKKAILRYIFLPLEVLYRIYSEIFLSIELRPGTKIGKNLRIDHGFGIVININTIIGENCHIRHGLTVGCKMSSDGKEMPSPKLGDNIEIGCHVSIIGNIEIGSNTKIGAGAVIYDSIQENSLVFSPKPTLIN